MFDTDGDGVVNDIHYDSDGDGIAEQILLDLKVGNGAMVAAVEPNVRVKVRDTLRLALNPERLHFFDPQSERAI